MPALTTLEVSFEEPLRQRYGSGRFPPIAELRECANEFPEEVRPYALTDLVKEHMAISWRDHRAHHRLDDYVRELGAYYEDEFGSLEKIDADLVDAEFVIRLEYAQGGDGATLEEYERRFPNRPDVAELLRRRVWRDPRYLSLYRKGDGCMGVVEVLFDRELRRTLADKAPHPDKDAAKFEEEARVTAGLQHPGTVPVYELYTSTHGQPHYTMFLVEGKSLLDCIADFHAQNCPQKGLHELLGNLRVVGETVAYAHSRGVLHRDLHPDNVRVGRFGEVQVVDWGLATRTADPKQDYPVGNPAYMPPEHLQGPIDVRSDIWGAGAILYQILTNRPPYDMAGKAGLPAEDVRRVADAAFPALRINPLTFRRNCLRAICCKAMSKDPEQRYQTMKAFVQDLKNWLSDETVSAYPESGLYRYRWLARVLRRNPWPFLLTLLLVLAVAGYAIYDRAQLDRQRDVADQQLALAQRRVDGDQLVAARDILLQLKGSLPERRDLTSLRARVDEALSAVEQTILKEKEFRAFLEKADDADFHLLGAYWALRPHEEKGERRRVPRTSPTSPSLRVGVERATAALKAAGLPENIGDFMKRHLLKTADDRVIDLRPRAGELLFLWALAEERMAQGERREEHHAACRRAVRLLETAEAVGNKSRSLYEYRARFLRTLGEEAQARDAQRQADARKRLTFLDHHLHAAALVHEQKWDDALLAYERAQALRPNHYWTLFRMAKAHEGLGATRRSREQISRAEALFRSCVALRPNDPTPYNNRGTLLLQLGRYDDAVEAFEKAIELDGDYLMAWGNLALAHAERKAPADAVKITDRFRQAHPEDKRELARMFSNIGLAHERGGQYAQAVLYYDKALALEKGSVEALRNRAISLHHLGRLDEAERDLLRAIELSSKDGDLHYVLGNVHAARPDDRKAIASYDRAIALAPGRHDAWYNRGVVLRRNRRFEEAVRDQTEVLKPGPTSRLYLAALLERALAYAHQRKFHDSFRDLDVLLVLAPKHLDGLITRGKVLGDLNDLSRSEMDLDLALRIAPRNADAHRSRGLTRLRAKNWAGAIADWRRYLQLRPDAPDKASILNDISVAYLHLNKPKEALRALDEAIALAPRAELVTNRANLLMKQGDLRRAVADCDRALKLNDRHTRAWALRGQARLRQGHYAAAVSDFDEALRLEPGVYETLLFRGLAHYHGGAPAKARKDWAVVAKDRPAHARGRLARGGLLLLDKQNARAAMAIAPVLDDGLLRPFALSLAARAHLESGGAAVAVAVGYAEELGEALPKDAAAQVEVARLYARAAALVTGEQAAAWRGKALKWLRSAWGLSGDVKGWVEKDRAFDAIRKDPRFPR